MTPSPKEALKAAADRAEQTAMAKWLNYSVSLKQEVLIHRLGFEERHIGNPVIRALHGGVIAAFLEFSANCALAAHTDKKLQSVNIAIDYLTSSQAADMEARINIKKLGRRIAFLEATGWQGNETKPVANAQICLRLV